MGLYSRVVFPRLCEFALNWPWVEAERKAVLANASGEILEIGIGTGLNLPHYPPHVRRLTAIDPNPGMSSRTMARSASSRVEVDHRILRGESLPFADNSFDCVVSTLTLCSIAGVEAALGEFFRVLKPGGRFLFLEHGLSPDPGVQKWQRRLNGLEKWLADNCHLDRDIEKLVRTQPYSTVDAAADYLKRGPRTHTYVTKGVATK